MYSHFESFLDLYIANIKKIHTDYEDINLLVLWCQ